MSKIENQSIYGHYEQLENRVTAALLQILKMGGTDFIGKVISEIDEIEFPSSEINITTQEKEDKNVYDGMLDCSFSFRVLVESKIYEDKIDPIQLQGLMNNAKNPNDYILYITSDNKKPQLLKDQNQKIYWANWKRINEILTDLNPNTEPLNFLISEFEKYLDFLNLLKFISPDQRVQIAAGSWGEPVALKHGFYACQNNRTSKASKYLSFYNNKGIHSLFEIIAGPENDVDLSKMNCDEVKQYLFENEPNYSSNEKRQFYRLKLLNDDIKIKNDFIDKNGNQSAYTMGVFRYTSIDKLLHAKTTKDL